MYQTNGTAPTSREAMNTTPSPASAAKRAYLSKVMKCAWTIVRRDGLGLAKALRKAWAWAKKKLGSMRAQQPQEFKLQVVRTTAKAVLVTMTYYTGRMNVAGDEYVEEVEEWLPIKGAVEKIEGTLVTLTPWGVRLLESKLA